jgi:hypothetical protein
MSGPVSGQNRTFSELNAKQTRALEGLLEGKTVTEVARTLRVRRQTVSEWRNRHPAFRAALEVAQVEKQEAMLARLGSVSAEAVDVLRELMKPEQGPRVRLLAANAIVKGVLATQGGKGAAKEPGGALSGFAAPSTYSGEAERERWKELTKFTPMERETMRQLYEMLVEGSRKLTKIGGEKTPDLIRAYRTWKAGEHAAGENGTAHATGNGAANGSARELEQES